jgi:hypothetical protein
MKLTASTIGVVGRGGKLNDCDGNFIMKWEKWGDRFVIIENGVHFYILSRAACCAFCCNATISSATLLDRVFLSLPRSSTFALDVPCVFFHFMKHVRGCKQEIEEGALVAALR